MPQALSVSDLEKILDDRKVQLRELAERRTALQTELDKVDEEIQSIIGPGGSMPKGRRRRRVKNEQSLRAHVIEMLSANRKGLSLGELAEKVISTGYKSHSKNFRNVLYQCLYNTPGITHDSDTGCYTYKKA